MTRPKHASSKNSKTQSRVAQAPVKAPPPPIEPPLSSSEPPSPPRRHELAANNYTLGVLDFAEPQMREIPELIALMLDEVWRHTSAQPIKVYFARYYKHQLSTGRRIGKALAEHMATCSRAASMMDGGNPWQ